MMKTTQNQAPTFESVWALIDKHAQERVESEARFDRELEKSRIEWEKKMAESDARWDKERKESEAKFDRGLEKSREEWEKKMAESRAEWDKKMTESRADHERRTKKLEELTGSWTHNHGSFAEEYFFNSFENG
ncbi:MAG: hypothetical protein LBC84_00215, partial [Prevotellaceae bacterium]|nr:hypothetical protein [Prevotellaceae bacterium]